MDGITWKWRVSIAIYTVAASMPWSSRLDSLVKLGDTPLCASAPVSRELELSSRLPLGRFLVADVTRDYSSENHVEVKWLGLIV